MNLDLHEPEDVLAWAGERLEGVANAVEAWRDQDGRVFATVEVRPATCLLVSPRLAIEAGASCHFCGGPSFPWLTDDATWAKVAPLLGQQQACFECFAAAWFALGHNRGEPFGVVAGPSRG